MEIRKHKKLNPQIWGKDNLLKKPVSDMIMLIMRSYLDSIRVLQHIDIDESDIRDVFVYGSSANYFYTKKSDIDICIVIDFDSVAAKNPNVAVNAQNFKLFYYNWAMTHHCKIYGRKTDVSIEKANNYFFANRYRSGPCWSVIKNEWTFKPIIVSDAEFKTIRSQARYVYKQMMHDFRRVRRNGMTMLDTKKMYDNIYASKNATHYANADQPITYMYIAFRKIRDRGIIAKLRDRMVELESKDFVLK